MNSRISESQAPTRPPEFRICSTLALCDHPGSALSKVNRINVRYSAKAITASHHDSLRRAANLGGSALSAERPAAAFSLRHMINRSHSKCEDYSAKARMSGATNCR